MANTSNYCLQHRTLLFTDARRLKRVAIEERVPAVPLLSSHRPLPRAGKSLWSHPGTMATLVRWQAAVRVFGLALGVSAGVTWQPPSLTPSWLPDPGKIA